MNKPKRCFLLLVVTFLLIASAVLSSLSVSAAEPSDIGGSYYLSENSNVDTLHATTVGAMPCIGEAKIIVFYVDFGEDKEIEDPTTEELENMLFSEKAKNDPSLAYTEEDSLRSFYYRSSKGKLDITGSVFEYTVKNEVSYYERSEDVLDEVIDYYRDTINWADYDGNSDGYVDGVYLVERNLVSLDITSAVRTYTDTVGDMKICKYCFSAPTLYTLIHESCHMLGFGDIYANVNVNSSGTHTWTVMDGSSGDLPAPIKFRFGWLDKITFISSDNSGFYELKSYSTDNEALIIYPKGDPSNKGWFFIEYITREGNNPELTVESGIRVWRTYTDMDEDYNPIGSTEFCDGMPPSGFTYIEALHPNEEWNYFMQVGDKITPYTSPSTSYGKEFYDEGNARYIKSLLFSGINISFIGEENGVATLQIDFDKDPDLAKKTNVTVSSQLSITSSDFIDSNSEIKIGMIISDTELEGLTELDLFSAKGNKFFKIKAKASETGKEIALYITPDMTDELKEYDDWCISSKALKTYYGADAIVDGSSAIFDFSSLPTPMKSLGSSHHTGFGSRDNSGLKYFRLSDTLITTVFYDNAKNKLYLGEINIDTNTVSKQELPLPMGLNISAAVNNDYIIASYDGGNYFVEIGNYIICYRDKELIASYELTGYERECIRFVGNESAPYYADIATDTVYKLSAEENSIIFKVELSGIPTYEIREIEPVDDCYLAVCYSGAMLVDSTGNIKVFTVESDFIVYPTVDVCYYDGFFYIFCLDADLTVYKCDGSFNFISKITILEDLNSAIWGFNDLNVSFENGKWVIYFDGISNLNLEGGENTYLLICDQRGIVEGYYKFGNLKITSINFRCEFIPVTAHKYISLKLLSYNYISFECNEHEFGDWVTVKEPDCENEGEEERICTECDSVEKRAIKELGHSFTNYQSDGNATCIADGTKTAKCDRCDKRDTVTEEKSVLGHSFTNYTSNNNATCTEDGTKTAKCDRCNETDTVADIDSRFGHDYADATCVLPKTCKRDGCSATDGESLGHSFTNYVSNKDATCTEDGTKTAKCDRCDVTDTLTDEGSALGHDFADATCLLPKTCRREGCDATEGNPLGHTYDNACDADCNTCSGERTPSSHVWDEGVVTKEPTKKEQGVKTYTCTVCKETKEEAIPVLTGCGGGGGAMIALLSNSAIALVWFIFKRKH